MEVLPCAIATSSVVVAASAASKESSSSSSSTGSSQKKVQVSFPFMIPFFRPASALAASILAWAPPPSLAVNYDDFIKKASESASSAASSASFPELPSIDLPSVNLPAVNLDDATDFVSANPVALVAGLAAVAVPFIASRAFAGTTPFGFVSAGEAYEKLSDPEQNVQLLDIRALEDIKAEGSPNLKSIRKTAIKVAYAAGDDKFVDKVLAKCKIAEDTTLYVLDRSDGNAITVAKLLANSGFKSAYAIKGGAEGQNGWLDKELPWTTPTKSFNLNIDGLKNILPDGEGVGSGGLSTTLGVAAAAGVGIVALSEVETTLQLLGTVALVQLFFKKFLFAEDRKRTVQEIKSFLDTKIAPKGFVEDVKEVGRVLLFKDSEIKAAVETGAAAIEKELNIDSVTPEALAEKAVEKLEVEAEKAGVEIPDLKGVTADLKSGAKELQSNVEAVTSDLKSGAQDLQSKAEGVTSDLESKADELQPKLEEVTSDLTSKAEGTYSDFQSKAEDATSDLQSKAEDTTSDLQSKAEEVSSDLGSDAKAVGSDLKTGAEEAKSAVGSTTESAKPSNGSASPEPADKKVVPFFEDERESALAAFEGDEPNAFEGKQVGEDITAKKLEGVTASGSADISS